MSCPPSISHLIRNGLAAGWCAGLWATGAFAQQAAPGGTTGPGMEPTPLPHPELPRPEIPAAVTSPAWFWILGGLMTVGALVLIWALMRARASSPPPLPKARREALQALRQLQAQSAQLPPADIAASVSSIIRRYLQLAYEVPAPRRTSRELFKTASALPSVKAVAPLAEMWDRLAFGPPVSTNLEAADLVAKALQHVESEMEAASFAPVK